MGARQPSDISQSSRPRAAHQRCRTLLRADPVARRAAALHYRKCGSVISCRMCDDTGLFQHAVHSVPDRAHGYCVDDNARALLLACALNESGEAALVRVTDGALCRLHPARMEPRHRRFRNFMSFDRRWLEASGSEDSHGANAVGPGRMRPQRRQSVAPPMGAALVRRGAAVRSRHFTRPAPGPSRCSGWTPIAPSSPDDLHARAVRAACLADRLMSLSCTVETPGLGLVRGRPRLRQRAPAAGPDPTGMATQTPSYVDAGFEIPALAHDAANRTDRDISAPSAPTSFGEQRQRPELSISSPWKPRRRSPPASRRGARTATPSGRPPQRGSSPGFSAATTCQLALVDPDTGSCSRWIAPDRANENMRRQSRCCRYLLGLAEIRQLAALQYGSLTRRRRRFAPSAPEFRFHLHD